MLQMKSKKLLYYSWKPGKGKTSEQITGDAQSHGRGKHYFNYFWDFHRQQQKKATGNDLDLIFGSIVAGH